MKFRAENKNGEYLNITELRVKDGKLKGSDTWFGTKENPCYAPSGVWYTNLEMFLHNKWQPVSELETPKRHPDSNGVLPLTSEELIEFINEFSYPYKDSGYKLKNIRINHKDEMTIRYENKAGYSNWVLIINYKAILWLAERFNLIGGE